MTGLLEFHIAISEILLTGFADQILYNLSLIKLWSTCAKQNAAVKTTNDACSLLAKQTLSDLFRQHPSLLIIEFEQVIQSFLVWNIYFTAF